MNPNMPDDPPEVEKKTFATNWAQRQSRIVDLLLDYSLQNAGFDLDDHPPIMMRTHKDDKMLTRVFFIGEEDIMAVHNTESNTYIRTRKEQNSPQDNGSRSRRKSSYISTEV